MTTTTRTTRLAPSPTGALHLGNARTFIINWALARQRGWRIIMRIEDLDGPRIKPDAGQQTLDILRWLGIDWDDGPYEQRANLTPYHHAWQTLAEQHAIYPCTCTRKEIEQAQSAPHDDDHETRYPGTCRPELTTNQLANTDPRMVPNPALPDLTDSSRITHHSSLTLPAWRLIVPDQPVTIDDQWRGSQTINVQQQVGDFVIMTKAGLPAYQLAVVVDDARQGVTDIVRGDDLLTSTARQYWLYHRLQFTPLPRYWHLPLVLGPDGRRLAKRHGDTRLATYRERGMAAERIIGLLAYWSGISDQPHDMNAETFAQRFDLNKLPPQPVTFTRTDEQWLTNTTTTSRK